MQAVAGPSRARVKGESTGIRGVYGARSGQQGNRILFRHLLEQAVWGPPQPVRTWSKCPQARVFSVQRRVSGIQYNNSSRRGTIEIGMRLPCAKPPARLAGHDPVPQRCGQRLYPRRKAAGSSCANTRPKVSCEGMPMRQLQERPGQACFWRPKNSTSVQLSAPQMTAREWYCPGTARDRQPRRPRPSGARGRRWSWQVF